MVLSLNLFILNSKKSLCCFKANIRTTLIVTNISISLSLVYSIFNFIFYSQYLKIDLIEIISRLIILLEFFFCTVVLSLKNSKLICLPFSAFIASNFYLIFTIFELIEVINRKYLLIINYPIDIVISFGFVILSLYISFLYYRNYQINLEINKSKIFENLDQNQKDVFRYSNI